jgi:Domain of unknown function (DUF4386)
LESESPKVINGDNTLFTEREKMISNRKVSIILGALFLVVMVSWSIGYGLIGSVLNSTDYLEQINLNSSKLFYGVLFELIDVAAIIGIMIVMFPLLKKYSERMAIGYVCFRILECVMLLVAIMIPLVLITLSKEFLQAGSPATSWYQTLGILFKAIRIDWVNLVLPFFYSLAAGVFYWFLYKTKLIPRFISIMGIIAAVLIIAGIPMDFFEFKPGSFVGAMGGLTEVLLGIWLIVKGFNSLALTELNKRADQ